jgi:hypothetical protein
MPIGSPSIETVTGFSFGKKVTYEA